MEEAFAAEQVIPGTFLRVLSEGLISAGGVSTGNIGIVGTAASGVDQTRNLSDYEAAVDAFGAYDAYDGGAGTLNLTRALELLFRNGARTVYARGVGAGANQSDFGAAFDEIVKEDVNILVAPELDRDTALAVLQPQVDNGETEGRDMIAVIGTSVANDADDLVNDIETQVPGNDRIVFTAPGVQSFDSAAAANVDLNGRYTAAPLAGLLSSLAPQTSPTNKVIPGVVKLVTRFSYGELVQLTKARAAVLEERNGVRVVRGLTTDSGAFTQITTRRIVDFAKAGMRQASNPFIGRLNNERVRAALQGAIEGFLTSMVVAEQLTGYSLEVTATRQNEIAGEAIVNAVLQPTFSIDFIKVTLVLA